MARWNLDATRAREVMLQVLATSWELHEATSRLDRDVGAELPTPLRIGVGINVGKAAVGVMGRLQDYTVLGDSVNIAFRLESATRTLDTDVVVSQAACDHLDPSFCRGRTRDITVKGRQAPVSVCTLTFEELDEGLSGGATLVDADITGRGRG